MARLFIFGIGGTGARVLRSLTMLMASGVQMGVDEIVPILIDPDSRNADLTRTTTLLRLYKGIKENIPQPNENGFFNTVLGSVAPNDYLELKNTSSMTFADYMGLKTMDLASKSLMEMLFSKKNLDSDMKVGFKGNPNIGSVVLNQLVPTETFQNFASLFSSGDKIFIVNSIFGGTGASGFPLLLKILRESQANDYAKAEVISKAVIGAVTVLPYFSIKAEEEEKSCINSTTFSSKAKSALAYYEDNIYKNGQIDHLYFIGDDMVSDPYDNNEGGSDQRNDAHLIEMMAATAIVDFSKVDGEHRPQKPCSKELALEDNNDDMNTITFKNFGEQLKGMLYQPMIEFALMANVFYYHYDDVKSSTLDANKNGEFSDIFSTDFMSELRDFLNKYREWLSEMENNKRKLKLFNLDSEKDPFKLVTHIEPKSSGHFWSRKGYDLLYHKLADVAKHITNIKKNDPSSFVEMYYLAMKDLVTNKF